jgi:hypothetical protein
MNSTRSLLFLLLFFLGVEGRGSRRGLPLEDGLGEALDEEERDGGVGDRAQQVRDEPAVVPSQPVHPVGHIVIVIVIIRRVERGIRD